MFPFPSDLKNESYMTEKNPLCGQVTQEGWARVFAYIFCFQVTQHVMLSTGNL